MNGPISKERDILGKRVKWLERSLILAGATVVAGLIGETGTLSSYLVTIGVAAEVILGIFITQTAERIQELAITEVSSANERIAELHERAAKAELDRAKLEAQLLSIQKQQAPRWISWDTRQSLVSDLKTRPKGTVTILYKPQDGEAWQFADQLWFTMRESGWTVNERGPSPFSNEYWGAWAREPWVELMPEMVLITGTSIGVAIVTHSLALNHTCEGTWYHALQEALKQCGLGFNSHADSRLTADKFLLVIGQKR